MRQLKDSTAFNHRQRALILHLLKHPETSTNVSAYCREHHVVRQTARTDLAQLADMGLLQTAKLRREFIYTPAPDFEQRVKGM